MKDQKKNEDLGIKIGSDEMVFWQRIIDAYETDIKGYNDALKLAKVFLEKAKEEYKKAEEEFNKK